MMARRVALLLLLAAAALVGPDTVAAPGAQASPADEPPRVTVADLLAEPEAYTEVVVRGELVGDFGERGDGTVWAQLNGDAYADAPLLGGGSLAGANVGIGVCIPAGIWPGFDRPGGYRTRGPVVDLQGTWRYHDPGRGGESYLEVTRLELVEAPVELSEGVRWLPLGLGAGLLLAAGGMAVLVRRRRD